MQSAKMASSVANTVWGCVGKKRSGRGGFVV